MHYRIHCTNCLRPRGHCYCSHIVSINNTYPVKILQSAAESKHPFNTGRIAALSLQKCEVYTRTPEFDLEQWLHSTLPKDPVLAFPSSDAANLSEISLEEHRPIIFIDDTWRKAKRLLYENPELNALPKVCLPSNIQSGYALRQAKKHTRNQCFKHSPPMSTLESIVLSLGILENRRDVYAPILDTLHTIVQKQQTFIN